MKRIIIATALAFSFAAMPAIAEDHEVSLATLLKNGSRIMRALEILEAVETGILLTERKCKSLGDGWADYAPIGGRFPLASGTGVDGNGEERSFGFEPEPYREGGTYRHRLTSQEMPSHQHKFSDKHLNNHGDANVKGDDDDEDREYSWERKQTESEGRNMPHNNMPPYLVLNFCRWSSD